MADDLLDRWDDLLPGAATERPPKGWRVRTNGPFSRDVRTDARGRPSLPSALPGKEV